MSVSKTDRLVLTGGGGFVGTALLRKLKGRGYTNVAVVRRKDFDLTHEADVDRLYRDVKPAVVLHLAAEVGGIGANRDNPGRYFFANMAMGLHLIEGARRHGIKKFLQTGTICAYPNLTPVPFKEANLWNGYPEVTNAPYGIAKKSLLVQCQAYREQYGTNAIYLLPVNLYGPGDNFDLESSHVIPALIRKCVEGARNGSLELVCWGDGSPTREFLYVEDAAAGIAAATERYDQAEPVNLGSGEEISIKELSEKIAALTGFRGRIVWDDTRPNGQPRSCLDVTRAEQSFGFKAATSLDAGLQRTIDWYVTSLHLETSSASKPDLLAAASR